MIKKADLIQHLHSELLNEKASLLAALDDLKQDKHNQQKSSAGDKFETEREMARQTENQLLNRLDFLNRQMVQLSNLNESKICQSIEHGALVDSSQGKFFFCISKGKLNHEGEDVYVLSINAPLGKAFWGRKVGQSISYMNKNYIILTIQ